MYVCVCLYTLVQVLQEARGIQCPGTGVTGGCLLPNRGAGSQTQALRRAARALQCLALCPAPTPGLLEQRGDEHCATMLELESPRGRVSFLC